MNARPVTSTPELAWDGEGAIAPELVAEMVTMVRGIAQGARNAGWNLQQDAIELAAKLPVPVDPDIEEARKIAAKTLIRLGASDEQIAAFDIADGKRDDAIIVHATLAAIKRGRELGRVSRDAGKIALTERGQ